MMRWERSIILKACTLIAMAGQANLFAADDDVTEFVPRQADLQLRPSVSPEVFERWVYGSDAKSARGKIDHQLSEKINQLRKKHDLTEAAVRKLELAARADKSRLNSEIADLKARFEACENILQLRAISQEALQLRKKQMILFDSQSFFFKATQSILAEAERSADHSKAVDVPPGRHLANLDAAIRIIERRVDIRQSQRDALMGLLSREIPVPKKLGNYDDLIVQHQLSRLPAAKWKPLFDEDQWPQVRIALASAKQFDSLLIQKHLIEDRPRPGPIDQDIEAK